MTLSFPTMLFHKDHAPDGRVFSADVDLPNDLEGWVDTPAKFRADYKDPPPLAVPPGTVPEAERLSGYVPQLFPTWRFPRAGGDPKFVASAEDLAELDPAEWLDTPDVAAYDKRVAEDAARRIAEAAHRKAEAVATTPAVPTVPAAPATAPSGAPTSLASLAAEAAAPPPETKAPEKTDLEKQTDFYKASVTNIVTALDACDDVALVTRLGEWETANPTKPRKSVQAAVKARLKALTTAKGIDESDTES
jgi:hypothetical protein